MPCGDDAMMKQYIIEQLSTVEDAIEEIKSESATTESIVDDHTIELSKQKKAIEKISERIDEISKELLPDAPSTQADRAVEDDPKEIETARHP